MKVLLTQDIDRIGKAGQIKDVADGYARNYLLPKGLAIAATQGALKQADTIRKTEERRQAQLFAEAKAIASQLEGHALTFQAKAGESGKLYGSVTAHDITEAVLEQIGLEIDKRKIDLHEPIRTVGTHTVPVKLATSLVANLSIIVEAEAAPGAESGLETATAPAAPAEAQETPAAEAQDLPLAEPEAAA
ncbi:MAG: 50S ribosomal protein L9 [Thermoflexales bacterium]|nr:50S ribosomal protein L9 [Thermoflexales bacterium]